MGEVAGGEGLAPKGEPRGEGLTRRPRKDRHQLLHPQLLAQPSKRALLFIFQVLGTQGTTIAHAAPALQIDEEGEARREAQAPWMGTFLLLCLHQNVLSGGHGALMPPCPRDWTGRLLRTWASAGEEGVHGRSIWEPARTCEKAVGDGVRRPGRQLLA